MTRCSTALIAELADHYGYLIDPARALKPKDKAWATDCTSWLDGMGRRSGMRFESPASPGSDPSCRAPSGRVGAGSAGDAAVLATLALSPSFGDRLAAASAGDRGHRFGRRVETLALVVVLQPRRADRALPDSSPFGDARRARRPSRQGQHALASEAIEAALEAVRLADLPDDPDGELIAHGRLMTGGVESRRRSRSRCGHRAGGPPRPRWPGPACADRRLALDGPAGGSERHRRGSGRERRAARRV